MKISRTRFITIFLISAFVLATSSCRTSKSKHSLKTDRSEHYNNLLVDKDGTKYAVTNMLDNNVWMTVNLRLNIPGSYSYDNARDSKKYGRVYTWEAARNGCALFGAGWRLPTNAEWQHLATLYGGIPEDPVENRKRAYQRLVLTGNSLFAAILGGGRDLDGEYRRIGAHGFYWTATENDSRTAWFSNFGKNSKSLYHQNEGDKGDAFSVRCINSTLKNSSSNVLTISILIN